MADRNSTSYMFFFAGAVCLVCSIFVASSAVALKPKQDANKLIDRQKKVLSVAGLIRAGEKLSPEVVAERFEANIVSKVIDLETGEYVDDIDAASYDMRKASADPSTSTAAPEGNPAKVMRLPNNALVYQVLRDGKVANLILPMHGKGLWSTLYGFLAVESDAQTVSGIVFYEHAETPGLGGEVDNPRWRSAWRGRKIYGDDGQPKISVIKGAAGSASADPYHVDGLSGATITSRGVSYLVQFWMGDDGFKPYLDRFKTQEGA